MQEKDTKIGKERKPGEGQPWPESGKQGGQGQGDVGKKGAQDGDMGRRGDPGKGKGGAGEVGKKP